MEISRAISDIGEKKAAASLFELFVFGVLAGIYIACRAFGSRQILLPFFEHVQ